MKYSHLSWSMGMLIPAFIACGPGPEHERIPEPDRALRIRDMLLHQLVGHWVDGTSNSQRVFHEVWNSDGRGIGFVMSGKDTLWTEHLALRYEGIDRLEYVALVPDQNDGGAIPFEWRPADDSTLVFVNEGHDFPQRIEYRRTRDGWRVAVSGANDGRTQKEVFVFLPFMVNGTP